MGNIVKSTFILRITETTDNKYCISAILGVWGKWLMFYLGQSYRVTDYNVSTSSCMVFNNKFFNGVLGYLSGMLSRERTRVWRCVLLKQMHQ